MSVPEPLIDLVSVDYERLLVPKIVFKVVFPLVSIPECFEVFLFKIILFFVVGAVRQGVDPLADLSDISAPFKRFDIVFVHVGADVEHAFHLFVSPAGEGGRDIRHSIFEFVVGDGSVDVVDAWA